MQLVHNRVQQDAGVSVTTVGTCENTVRDALGVREPRVPTEQSGTQMEAHIEAQIGDRVIDLKR